MAELPHAKGWNSCFPLTTSPADLTLNFSNFETQLPILYEIEVVEKVNVDWLRFSDVTYYWLTGKSFDGHHWKEQGVIGNILWTDLIWSSTQSVDKQTNTLRARPPFISDGLNTARSDDMTWEIPDNNPSLVRPSRIALTYSFGVLPNNASVLTLRFQPRPTDWLLKLQQT